MESECKYKCDISNLVQCLHTGHPAWHVDWLDIQRSVRSSSPCAWLPGCPPDHTVPGGQNTRTTPVQHTSHTASWRIDRLLEMTSDTRQKCRNLRYAITYNVIWANQKTESFEYDWLLALANFVWHNEISRYFVGHWTSFQFKLIP